MATPKTYPKRLAKLLVREALMVARGAIRPHSRTLAGRGGVRSELRPDGAALVIPHYWALYVHDGRDGFSKPQGFLVYWRNPAQDPRFAGRQTPERASQVRRLTKAEFREASAIRRRALKRGRRSPVVIVRGVGAVKKGATNFFENDAGMLPFKLAYPALAERDVTKFFREYLRGQVKFGQLEKRTLTIRL